MQNSICFCFTTKIFGLSVKSEKSPSFTSIHLLPTISPTLSCRYQSCVSYVSLFYSGSFLVFVNEFQNGVSLTRKLGKKVDTIKGAKNVVFFSSEDDFG